MKKIKKMKIIKKDPIFLASDHAGFDLKEKIKLYLAKKNHAIEDFGSFEFKKTDDYPDFIFPLAKKLSKSKIKTAKGIILSASFTGQLVVTIDMDHFYIPFFEIKLWNVRKNVMRRSVTVLIQGVQGKGFVVSV